jgi:hypothetical protein
MPSLKPGASCEPLHGGARDEVHRNRKITAARLCIDGKSARGCCAIWWQVPDNKFAGSRDMETFDRLEAR